MSVKTNIFNSDRYYDLRGDLIDASGAFSRLNENVPTIKTMSRSEASEAMTYLQGWLPHALAEVGYLHTDITSESTGYMRGDSYVHQVTQKWGNKPNPSAIREHGPILEVAGPTLSDVSAQKFFGVTPDIVSNISEINARGNIHLQADATTLPVRKGGVGTIFISCLPGAPRERYEKFSHTRDKALEEAYFTLPHGGRLLWQGGTEEDFTYALKLGFEPEFVEVHSGVVENPNGDFTNPDLVLYSSFLKN